MNGGGLDPFVGYVGGTLSRIRKEVRCGKAHLDGAAAGHDGALALPLAHGQTDADIYKNSNTRREKYLYAIVKKMQSLGAQAKSGDTRESGKAWVELYMCR